MVQGKNCRISLDYTNFAISYESVIGVELNELYSFASFILVHASSDSSIPDEKSTLQYFIEPDDKATVFKGQSSTEVTIKMTPSIFQSDSNDWPRENYGYHLSQENLLIKGSVTDGKGILIIDPVLVNLNLVQSENLLLTKRSIVFFVSVLSALVGLIFGLLEVFSGLVSLFESKLKCIYKRFTISSKFHKIIESQKILLRNFNIKKKSLNIEFTKHTSKVNVEEKYEI
ncbi:hypothetical protein SteCoe_38463 [Stentor coeruleus]|uniref:Uncharacterized protein n=1 Tax=Stentor coeruleus TaxID=5963 RepID=A0A1R2ALP2_9CILI|nr:hypothetical protein SteCoe_38463 [Stentor coeruleus]